MYSTNADVTDSGSEGHGRFLLCRRMQQLHRDCSEAAGVVLLGEFDDRFELLRVHALAIRAHEIANIADGQDPTVVGGGRP